jgi:hypothetical protein
MAASDVPQRDPRKLPEFTLWRMTKDGRVAEARTRILPYADGLLDLIIYVSRADGTFDLHWSQTFSGVEVNELAQRTQRQYEVRGWTVDGDAMTSQIAAGRQPS